MQLKTTGFTHSKPLDGQRVRDANKVKSVEFCEYLIASKDTLDDVIFSGECSNQLKQNKSCNYRPKESHVTVIAKPKHPLKIYMWAAIGNRGASTIRLFEGLIDSEFYTNVILRDTGAIHRGNVW